MDETRHAAPDAPTAVGGAAIERDLEETDYGSRQFVLRDPAGGIWSLGTWYE
jgi:uncharacterized glyoxalase superfamily protein PhnB